MSTAGEMVVTGQVEMDKILQSATTRIQKLDNTVVEIKAGLICNQITQGQRVKGGKILRSLNRAGH